MKIKLDENMPYDLVLALGRQHEVDTAHSEGLQGRDDDAIWAGAQAESRFLITQDLDFSDLRRFMPGTHHDLLLMRLRNPSRIALGERVLEIAALEEFSTWERCFVVATDSKIRVRRPPP